MPDPKIDSKGRIVIPKSARESWQIDTGDKAHLRVRSPSGKTQSIRDEVDSRGRVTIPIETRETLGVSEGDRVEVDVIGVDGGGFECEECGDEYDLGKILILESGERIVCAGCSTPEDRIIT
ncbi:AbrB/MazE/SpoVT family DNA-binding domain-containing protein [Halovenus sp. HT40]|uniref:AbrB/MazE/SpoVT family DNA-binding domain-containing protein n=1 Tax=Halovenus sp. HT40 TaxID=3126691 RepID=UPI00300F4D22